MDVLKHTSPTAVAGAPKDSPKKHLPSSSAKIARIKNQENAFSPDAIEKNRPFPPKAGLPPNPCGFKIKKAVERQSPFAHKHFPYGAREPSRT
jgi:hypothetical protein